MTAKLKLIRIITRGNNFIGSICGILGAVGLFNVFTGTSWGLSARHSRSNGVAITTGEEVLITLLIAGIAILYHISFDRIKNDENLENLFYYIIDLFLVRFLIFTSVLISFIIWITESYVSNLDLILSSLIFSVFAVVHVIVISISLFKGFVLNLITLNLVPNNKASIEEKLMQLYELRNKNLITEGEFRDKKESILNQF